MSIQFWYAFIKYLKYHFFPHISSVHFTQVVFSQQDGPLERVQYSLFFKLSMGKSEAIGEDRKLFQEPLSYYFDIINFIGQEGVHKNGYNCFLVLVFFPNRWISYSLSSFPVKKIYCILTLIAFRGLSHMNSHMPLIPRYF